jgi:hypothetical protein
MNSENDFEVNKDNNEKINVNFQTADLKRIFNQQVAYALQIIEKEKKNKNE